jgi:mono/diheme cytochrome c family protein
MLQRTLTYSLLSLGFAALCACDQVPGKPKEADRWKPPEAIKNFVDLYNTHCLACHSNGKTVAASIAMNNPVYLSILSKAVLHKVISEGISGTTMPGFSKANGGDLTDEQINILVDRITAWGKHEATTDLPPYSAPLGDAQRGAAVFAQYCASCHGKDGAGGKAGSVVDGTYLSLVTDQYLRSVVIAGRPELGMPNYREAVPETPMNPDQIANVVAWLVSHRPTSPHEEKAPATDTAIIQHTHSNQQ